MESFIEYVIKSGIQYMSLVAVIANYSTRVEEYLGNTSILPAV